MSRRDLGESVTLFRALVAAYERLLPAIDEIRTEARTVEELLGVAEVSETVHERLRRYRKRLRQLEASLFAAARRAARQQQVTP
jgi:hypothetical protein